MPLPLFTRQTDDPAAHTPTIYDAHAATVNEMMDELEPISSATLHARYSGPQTLSATLQLADSDYPTQRIDCNGANRIVKMPAFAAANHAFFIINKTPATYTLDVQSSAGVTLLTTPLVANGGNVLVLPDGSAGFIAYEGGGGGVWGAITGTLSDQVDLKYFTNAPDGTMLNGKIVPTVVSSDLVVTLQTLAGNNPSAGEPVWVKIKGTWRSITAALAVTKADGTNWCNSGSAELATKEVDYFVYLIWNTIPATDRVDIGFSRIPYGRIYNDFSVTTTSELWLGYSGADVPAAADDVAAVGRFAATLSAGAGYTWTVPTYTNKNLIQHPIYGTRLLTYVAQLSRTGGAYTNYPGGLIFRYQLDMDRCFFYNSYSQNATPGSSGAQRTTSPFNAQTGLNQFVPAQNWSDKKTMQATVTPASANWDLYLYDGTAECLASKWYQVEGIFTLGA